MNQIQSLSMWEHIGESVLLIIILFILYKIVIYIFHRRLLALPFFQSNRPKTFILMFTSFIRFLFIFVGIVALLDIYGIDMKSVMASVGVIGIIIGFAIQDALKDIVKGIDIITENYYHVGDVIEVNHEVGVVKRIGIKTTIIQDIDTQNMISIANRNIQMVKVVSTQLNIDIPMPYELSLSKAEMISNEIVEICLKMEEVHSCEYLGIQEYKDSCANYRLRIHCDIPTKFQTRRQVLRTIVEVLEKYDIKIPYQKIEILSEKENAVIK